MRADCPSGPILGVSHRPRLWLRLLLLLRVLTQEDRESTELGGQNGPTPRESAKCEVLAWGFSNPLTQRGRGRVPLNDLEPNHYKRIRHIIYTIRASTGTPRASKDKTQITSIPTIYVYLCHVLLVQLAACFYNLTQSPLVPRGRAVRFRRDAACRVAPTWHGQ